MNLADAYGRLRTFAFSRIERTVGIDGPGKSDSIGSLHSIRSRFERGISWSMAAAAATSGFNFLLNIAIARLLGRSVFGEFGIVQTTVATAAGIATLAMGYTATKFVAEFRTGDPARAGRIIGLCSAVAASTAGIAAFILWAAAPWLATTTLRAPQLTHALQLAIGTVFFSVLTGYQTGVLAGLESYRSIARVAVLSGIANVVACVWAGSVWGLNGAIAGTSVGAMVQWLMFRMSVQADCRLAGIEISRKAIFAERGILFSFAIPAALSGFSSMPALWMANALLVRKGGGFAQMALYAAAFNVRSFVFFVPTLVNRVTTSLLNNEKGLRNWDSYSRVFRTNIGLCAVSVLAAISVVSIVGVPILTAFGKDFREGYPVLLLVLLSALPEALAMAIVQVVHSESRLWLSFFAVALPKDCFLVGAAYLLTPRYGALGLAGAYAGAWFLTVVTVLITARVSWPDFSDVKVVRS